MINTEHHVDHIFGNYYFRGAGPVIAHAEVAANFMLATQHPSPYTYAREALPTDDPEGVAIFPDEETYFQDPNRPAITFTQDLTLRLGGHTFDLLFTPGHTVGQIAVHVPEERVVFTGDTIFSQCQTWLYVSNIDQWLAALERIRTLDVDHVVPGHGPVTTKAYVDVQRGFLMEWVTAVAIAVGKGWTKEECVARISFADRYPVDIGQEYMMDHIQRENVSALYDKLSAGIRP
jgi:cyclase